MLSCGARKVSLQNTGNRANCWEEGEALRILLCTLAKKPAHCITLTPWTTAETVGTGTIFKNPALEIK